jgi:hypothetical protein
VSGEGFVLILTLDSITAAGLWSPWGTRSTPDRFDNQYKEGQGKHMKRISIVGLCLAAVCAFSAVTVASASAALPEFILKSGKSFPITFDFSSGKGKLTPHSTLLPIIECESDLGKGTITGSMLAKITTLTYHECHIQGSPHTCTTSGQPTGLIVGSVVLMVHLGYIKKNGEAGKETGFLVKPETGTVNAEFECEGLAEKVVVEGEVVGQVTSNLNEFRETATITFSQGAKRGEQAIETFELLSGLPEPLFMTGVRLTALGGPASLASVETIELLPSGETVEIKA